MSVLFYRGEERPYPYNGYRSVHVEARAEGNIWHQRHVWTREDGTLHIEDWIPSFASFFRGDGYKQVLKSDLAGAP